MIVKTKTKGNYTLQIWVDDFPENPREWDNLGTLYIPYPPRGYELSDDDATEDAARTAPVKMSVYILDHSRIKISAVPFGDPWDSWTAGAYYVTADKIVKEYGNMNDAAIRQAFRVARTELETFAEYIEGNVYGYHITDHAGEMVYDSCAGYYGNDGIHQIEENFCNFVEYREKTGDYPLFAGIKNAWNCCSNSTPNA